MCDHCGCRKLPPIAELTAEHERIQALGWQIVTADGDPRARARVELLALLARHVAREEELLYPLLVETGDLTSEARTKLEDEHREMHAVLEGDAFDRRAYYALSSHIEEEESELFPLAMFGFDDDDWDQLAGSADRRGADPSEEGSRDHR